MSHGPGCLVAFDLQHPLKQEHGDAAFLPSHQKDHPEPFPQGCSALMEDGPCSEGYLIAACRALVQVAVSMEICVMVVTSGQW